MSQLYQAYNHIHRFIEESYRSMIQGPLFNETIFNSSRFMVNNLGKLQPDGINKVYIYYTLATLGFKFETYKTARVGYEKLTTLRIPDQWAEEIEIDHLKIRSKPFSDKEGFNMVCNRCMGSNPLINPNGDKCISCGNPIVRNFCSFDTLPLVEFKPDPSLAPDKVKKLLRMDPV